MRDTELYFHLLGLVKPWSVESIELAVEKLRVDVKVEHPTGYVWQCPQCLARQSHPPAELASGG